jgi:hypothetical protein
MGVDGCSSARINQATEIVLFSTQVIAGTANLMPQLVVNN